MSQIDKIVYIPLIVWFIILILVLYFIVFSFFLTIFLSIFKVRVLYFNKLNDFFNNNYRVIAILVSFNKVLFSTYFLYLNKLNKLS